MTPGGVGNSHNPNISEIVASQSSDHLRARATLRRLPTFG